MAPNKAVKLNLLLSLITAITIIALSWILRDKGYGQMPTFIILAIWIIPFTWLSSQINGDSK